MSPVPGPPMNLLYWVVLAIAVIVLIVLFQDHVRVG